MSGKATEPNASVGSTGSAATEISFCPHLGLYRYKRADGVDYMFDTAQLEVAIESYVKAANPKEAEFMAFLTACARKFPHQVVSFDERGQCKLAPLEAQKPYVDPDQATVPANKG